jgi:uncharacterized lipoprotein YehR (DUF1307 family)
MKQIKLIFALFLVVSMSMAISSCGTKGKSDAKMSGDTKTETPAKQGKEYTSAYICPMHCEGSGTHEARKCPVCGMDYKKNKNFKGNGHEGHNH